MFPAGRRQVISQEVDTAAVNIICEGGMPDMVLCAVAGLPALALVTNEIKTVGLFFVLCAIFSAARTTGYWQWAVRFVYRIFNCLSIRLATLCSGIGHFRLCRIDIHLCCGFLRPNTCTGLFIYVRKDTITWETIAPLSTFGYCPTRLGRDRDTFIRQQVLPVLT